MLPGRSDLCPVQYISQGTTAREERWAGSSMPHAASGPQNLDDHSPSLHLSRFHLTQPTCTWLCFCLPALRSPSPAGQVQRFQHLCLLCPSRHLTALCHQQVPAAGTGFPSCDRIRKQLQFFPSTLYGQPWRPELPRPSAEMRNSGGR